MMPNLPLPAVRSDALTQMLTCAVCRSSHMEPGTTLLRYRGLKTGRSLACASQDLHSEMTVVFTTFEGCTFSM